MPWNTLAGRILTGSNGKNELEVENRSEYDQWVSELYSEIEVFVKRVNGLDLSEAKGRDQFYNFAGRLSDRLLELRERSESSAAPAEALIQVEELIEKINESSSKIHVSVAYIGEDPFEKARREMKRKKREREKTEKAREKRDAIADKIQQLTAAFEADNS